MKKLIATAALTAAPFAALLGLAGTASADWNDSGAAFEVESSLGGTNGYNVWRPSGYNHAPAVQGTVNETGTQGTWRPSNIACPSTFAPRTTDVLDMLPGAGTLDGQGSIMGSTACRDANG